MPLRYAKATLNIQEIPVIRRNKIHARATLHHTLLQEEYSINAQPWTIADVSYVTALLESEFNKKKPTLSIRSQLNHANSVDLALTALKTNKTYGGLVFYHELQHTPSLITPSVTLLESVELMSNINNELTKNKTYAGFYLLLLTRQTIYKDNAINKIERFNPISLDIWAWNWTDFRIVAQQVTFDSIPTNTMKTTIGITNNKVMSPNQFVQSLNR